MLRRFAPLAAVYSVVAAMALPVSPLAAEEAVQPTAAPGTQAAEEPAEPPATRPAPEVPPDAPAPAPKPPEPRAQSPEPDPAPASEPSDAPKPIAVAAGADSVSIRDFAFSPGSITIAAGDTVTWTNSGPSQHSATGGGFDTGLLEKGQSGSHTFGQAGSYSYICTPHPFMKGTVVVRAASSGGGASGNAGGSQGSSAGSSGAGSGSSGAAGGATLPRSGADALPLAVLGFGLLALGFFSRRRLES
jgi:plastocyanin